jgi:hypothetical protein
VGNIMPPAGGRLAFLAGVAVAAGAVTFGSLGAGAAPIPGGAILAPSACIPYGSKFRVTGHGFTPSSTVALEVPLERYDPIVRPGTDFTGAANTLVATGPTGSFVASIRAPLHGPAFQPRLVVAIDRGQQLAAGRESDAFILVATASVCRTLQHLPGQ